MKFTGAIVVLATIASASASDVGDEMEWCNLQEIRSKMFKNGTDYADNCAEQTGFDIFEREGWPSEELAKNISENRNCVEAYNQIPTVANSLIDCEIECPPMMNDTCTLRNSLSMWLSGLNESSSDSGSSSMSDSESGSDSSTSESGSSESSSDSKDSSADESGSDGVGALIAAKSAVAVAGIVGLLTLL